MGNYEHHFHNSGNIWNIDGNMNGHINGNISDIYIQLMMEIEQ